MKGGENYMDIQPDVYYTPRDIEKHRLIVSTKRKASYNWVLRQIKLYAATEGKEGLKAENRGHSEAPYYWVKGSDLIEYRKKNNLFVGQ